MVRWWHRLSVRIAVVMVLLALIPLVGFGIFSLNFSQRALVEEIQRANREVALRAVNRVETSITRFPETLALVLDLLEFTDLELPDQEWALQTLLKKFPAVLSFTLLDSNGNETVKLSKQKIYLSGDLTNRSEDSAFTTALQGKVYTGPVQITPEGDPFMTLSLPLFSADQRTVNHILVINITLQLVLNEIVTMGVASSGRIYILTEEGRLIAHPDFSLVRAETNLSDNPIFQSFIDQSLTNEIQTYINENGTEVIGLGMVSQNPPWLIIIEQSTQDALAATDATAKGLMVVLAITLLFVLLVALLISKIFSSPIIQLTKAIKRVANGDLNRSISIQSQSEIGQLANSFDQMLQTLREVTDIATAVAVGDYSRAVEARSDHDLLANAVNQMLDNLQSVVKQANTIAQGDYSTTIMPRSEQDLLGNALFEMTKNLRAFTEEDKKQNWVKTGQTELNNTMHGEQELKELAQNTLSYLAARLDVTIGAIYLTEDNDLLKMVSSYAYTKRRNLSNVFKFGEGLVGQAALEQKSILITNAPEDYLMIRTGMGEAVPHQIYVVPILFEGKVSGVLELGSFDLFTDHQMEFLNQAAESIGVNLNSAQSRTKLKALLEETQSLAEELQTQQEELRQTNEELEEKSEELQQQQEELRQANEELEEKGEELVQQQEELRQTNEELEGKSETLEQQQKIVQAKNQELEQARQQVEEKARTLEITNRYKSEFLANMSHELRTPLNSLLIFAQLLTENKTGNLSEKQMKMSSNIYASGSELLALINDVLDLAKVESGKVELEIENFAPQELIQYVERNFQHLAEKKGVALRLEVDENCPALIHSDRQKLEQILKNLLSNAFKFTETGSVTFRLSRSGKDLPLFPGLDPGKIVALAVSDTGIGIPTEKQILVFEAFLQADGSTNRQYGGTGLGLSISRELARVLGGEIELQSEEGRGSTFTLYLPVKRVAPEAHTGLAESDALERDVGDPHSGDHETLLLPSKEDSALHEPEDPHSDPNREVGSIELPPAGPPQPDLLAHALETAAIEDDRGTLSPEDKSILIVEDDPKFAKVLLDLAQGRGFKGVIALNGEQGLEWVEKILPSAIILDIQLPKVNGWTVMERLKSNPQTRPIPVHFISAVDKQMLGMQMGAIGFLKKPVQVEELHQAFEKIETALTQTIKQLLIVEDDEKTCDGMLELLNNSDELLIHSAKNAKEARQLLQSTPFDCMILDLNLPDMTGFELLRQLKTEKNHSLPPVIVYTGKELSQEEERELRKYAKSIIIKSVQSSERLVDETSLFLHRIQTDFPAKQRQVYEKTYDQEELLRDKKILVVDDDMRNVYAILDVLEDRGMQALTAANGKEALRTLEKHPEVDLVLMDIMMPVMDGYEAMQEIRKQKTFKHLPIISLTAKAMKGDKEKCIEAGANDYLTKPIEIPKLLSLMRVWLYQ